MRYTRTISVAAGTTPTDPGATIARTGVFYPGAVHEAIYAAANGDTLLITPTVYNNWAATLTKNLTFRSSVPGQRYVFDVGGVSHGQNRCIELSTGIGLTLEDAELRNNKQEYSNAAGIWPSGGPYTLIVRRSSIHDLNNGILIGDHREATVLLEDSEFYDCGDYNGFGHNIYVGPVKSLSMRGCWSHMVKNRGDPGVPNADISWGHLVKSRAQLTDIQACRLTQEKGEANRCIDLPNGGDATVRGCLLELSANNPQNNGYGQFVSFGVEEAENPMRHTINRFNFQQNTCVNHATQKKQFLFIKTNWCPTPPEYSVTDNVIAALTSPYVQVTAGAEGDVYQLNTATNTFIGVNELAAKMPGHASMDFRLIAPVAGSKNWAQRAYQHPTSSITRSDSYRGGCPA